MALVAAFAFIIMFSLAGAINIITGTPLIGGLALNIVFSFIMATALLIIRKPGTASLLVLIYSALSVPTANFGPPGIYKIIMGLIMGIIVDIVLYYGKYKKLAYYFGIGLVFFLAGPLLYIALILLKMPAANKIAGLMIPLMIIYLVEALIGTFLAFKVYNKIKDKSLIRQLSY